jgi:hypothetical protein
LQSCPLDAGSEVLRRTGSFAVKPGSSRISSRIAFSLQDFLNRAMQNALAKARWREDKREGQMPGDLTRSRDTSKHPSRLSSRHRTFASAFWLRPEAALRSTSEPAYCCDGPGILSKKFAYIVFRQTAGRKRGKAWGIRLKISSRTCSVPNRLAVHACVPFFRLAQTAPKSANIGEPPARRYPFPSRNHIARSKRGTSSGTACFADAG